MSWVLSAILDGDSLPRLDLVRSIGAAEEAAPVRSRIAGGAGPGSPVQPVQKYFFDAGGLYRVFNAAVYRLYRSSIGPPGETDVPFATAESLPATPADTFADGTWYLSVSYFNGVVDSGFLPLGPQAETYVRVDVAGGEVQFAPPTGPTAWQLVAAAGGAVRVVAHLFQSAALAPQQWAIGYTIDGSTPPADSPTVTQAMPAIGLVWLDLLLPAQAHGTTVKVRLQTRRNDGSDLVPVWVYSDGSTVLAIAADAQGPSAPTGAVAWPGQLPEDL